MANPLPSLYDVLDDAIDHAAVWGVIAGHLPQLLTEIETLLAELEPR